MKLSYILERRIIMNEENKNDFLDEEFDELDNKIILNDEEGNETGETEHHTWVYTLVK